MVARVLASRIVDIAPSGSAATAFHMNSTLSPLVVNLNFKESKGYAKYVLKVSQSILSVNATIAAGKRSGSV